MRALARILKAALVNFVDAAVGPTALLLFQAVRTTRSGRTYAGGCKRRQEIVTTIMRMKDNDIVVVNQLSAKADEGQ